MNRQFTISIAAAVLLLGSTTASAAYTVATSPPLSIDSIYLNEWGDPFVRFSTAVNSSCIEGNSLYLYNREVSPVDETVKERRKNKMAMTLSAKLSGSRVVIEYYYDSTKYGAWDACYIHGIRIID